MFAGGKGILKQAEKNVHQPPLIQAYLEGLLASSTVKTARHESAPFHVTDPGLPPGEVSAGLGQILTSHRRLVVIGPARYGKSRLLVSILHDYASQAAGKGNGTTAHLSYCDEVRVPLYLDLAQLSSSHSLEGLASRSCSEVAGQEISTDCIASLLGTGECVVLLDHLDRLAGRQHLEGLNALREFMVDRYPQQRYVMALQEHEYPLLEDWLPTSHSLNMAPLLEEEVLLFWHAQYGEAAARRVSRLLHRRRLWGLVQDPFFLPVVAGLVREPEGYEPTRAEVLATTVEAFLAGAEACRAALAELALDLHRKGENQFERSLCEELFANGAKGVDSSDACRGLLSSGILRSDAEGRQLRFRHECFRDFLSGEALRPALDSGSLLMTALGHVGEEWSEPLSLLYGSTKSRPALLEALVTPDASLLAVSLACYCVTENEPAGKVREALHPRFFDPQTNFLLGKALRRAGCLEEARLELDEALRFRPERADIHYELAGVLSSLGRSEGALASYQRASSLAPPSVELALDTALEGGGAMDTGRAAAALETALQAMDRHKARLHARLAEVCLADGRAEDALAQASKSLLLDRSAASLTLLGRVQMLLHNRDEARSTFQLALEGEPHLASAQIGLAQILEEEGELDGALALYKQVVAQEPQDPGHYLNLGRVYRRAGQAMLSKVYTTTALDLDAGCHAALAEMAALLEAQERYNEAAEQLRRAIDLSPLEAGYHYRLGWLLKLAGRPVPAETELRTAIDLNAGQAEYYNQLGVVLAEMDRRREALGAYQRAGQLDPSNPLYQRNTGVALAQLGHNQEALRAFERTILLCREQGSSEVPPMTTLIAADAHSERGQILEGLGETEAALAEYEAAVELMPTESAYRLRQALVYGQFSDPSRMLQVLRRTVQMRPDDGPSYHHLGEALEALGDLEEAIASYERAVELAPGDSRFWLSLGRAQLSAGMAEASVESLSRLRDLRPGEAASHYQLGLSLEMAGRVQEAEECFRASARQDVNREDYWMALGRCCRNEGKLSESQAALRRVLFLNPANTMAHSELAETHLRQGRPADALTEVLFATRGDPEVGHYQHQAARIYGELGQQQERLQSLRRATELEPARSDWRRDLGEALEQSGQPEAALEEYELACQSDPASSRGLYLLGRLHYRQGRAEEALEELDRSVELAPADVEASVFLSRLLLERGDAERALDRCRALMAVAPDNPQPFYLGFKSLLALGREPEAIEVLERATSLCPDDPEWQRELGECYSGVGRLLEAQQSYQRALEIRADPELRRDLAHLYRKMGWKQEAIRELERALEEASELEPQARGMWLLDLGDFHQDSRGWENAMVVYEAAGALLADNGPVQVRRASLLVRTGRYQEAREEIERAMADGLADPRASHALSQALQGLGDIEGSARHAIKAAFGDPANPSFQRHLGSVLRIKGDLSSAVNYLQRALDLSPGDPYSLHEMGLAVEDKGNSVEALRLFREAAELEPDEHEFHLDLGRALLKAGAVEDAAIELERALETDPEDARSRFLLAQALEGRGYLERAKEQYEAAVRLAPQTSSHLYRLGKALEALGDFPGAIHAIRRAVEMEPGQASWHSDLAALYSLTGEAEMAAGEHRIALDLAPQNYDHSLRAAAFYRENGMASDAAALLEKATAMAPGRPEAFHQLGLARLELGQGQEALRAIQRALELAPREVVYQIDLANAFRRNGDYAEAARRLLAITKALPESAEAHCSLGLALAEQRWHGEAIAPLSKAVELDPDEPRYRCALSRTMIALNQLEEALDHLREAAASTLARPAHLVEIGSLLEEMGRPEDALSVYRQGLEREQGGELYYQAARVLRLLTRPGDSIAALRAALALEEKAAWHNELGELLEEQGEIAEALPCFQRAARLDPRDPAYHRNLGVALEKLHRYDAARDALEEAVRLRSNFRDALGHLASVTAKLTLEREVKKRSSQH